MSGRLQPDSPHMYRSARLLRRSKGLHKLLYNRLGLPLGSTDAIISGIKRAWNTAEVKRRISLAAEFQPNPDDERLQHDGYLELNPRDYPEHEHAISACLEYFERARRSDALKQARAAGPKDYLVSVIRNSQALQHPDVMAFAVSRPVLALASKYFGSVPLLSSVRFWWTPPNSTTHSSQLFHCDREDDTQLKILVNITDATSTSGPFTVIPANTSNSIKSALNYSHKRYQLSDEEISQVADLDKCVPLTGPAGTIYCVDTSRCFHYGSRRNESERKMLMLQFTHCLAPNVTVPVWIQNGSAANLELDELQRLALGLTEV